MLQITKVLRMLSCTKCLSAASSTSLSMMMSGDIDERGVKPPGRKLKRNALIYREMLKIKFIVCKLNFQHHIDL